jgi:hypothetical protein
MIQSFASYLALATMFALGIMALVVALEEMSR